MEDIYGSATAAVGNYLPTKTIQEGPDHQIIIPNGIDNEESRASKYLVGCLDALGFKYLIENKSMQEKDMLKIAYNSVLRIRSLIDLLEKGEATDFDIYIEDKRVTNKEERLRLIKQLLGEPQYAKEILNNSIPVSDSIIFFIKIDEEAEKEKENIRKLETLCKIINFFISKPILQPPPDREDVKPLPCRAAISSGLCIIDRDKHIFFGKPIIEAYDVMNVQEWMGGAVCSSVPENWVKECVGYDKPFYNNKPLIKYNVPIKNNQPKIIQPKYALNWPQSHPDIFKRKPFPTRSDLGGHITKWEWGDQEEKKKNTLDFIKEVCEP